MAGDGQDDAGSTSTARFQFSLRDLMLIGLATAVAASRVKTGEATWADGLLTAVGVLFVVGLLRQSRDLWTAFHGRADLAADQRWGWRFAALWRSAVVGLLAGYYVLTMLVDLRMLTLPSDELLWFVGLREGFCYLLLVIVLSSIPGSRRERRISLWARGIGLASWCAGLFLALLVWSQETLVHNLVLLSVLITEEAWPLRLAPEGTDLNVADRVGLFYGWSSSAFAVWLRPDLPFPWP